MNYFIQMMKYDIAAEFHHKASISFIVTVALKMLGIQAFEHIVELKLLRLKGRINRQEK